MIDTIFISNDSLQFRENLLGWVKQLIMTTDDKIGDEELQFYINREATKLSPLP